MAIANDPRVNRIQFPAIATNELQITLRNAHAACHPQSGARGHRAQKGLTAAGVRFSFMLWAPEKQAPFDRCVEIGGEAGYNGIE